MDKITGLDLVVDCDAYDEFADYCEQCLATSARNFGILNRNIDIFQRNIAKVVKNYKLDEVYKIEPTDGMNLSDAEVTRLNSLRAVNLDDFDVLREKMEQFKIELSKINPKSQKDLEISIERFGMLQDVFENNIQFISLKSYSSESFEELEGFEKFPTEPEPPKW